IVNNTIGLRHEQVRVVESRYEGGIGSQLEVAQAETELATTEADAASLAQRRGQFEKPPSLLVGANTSRVHFSPRTKHWKRRCPRRFQQVCRVICWSAGRTWPRRNASWRLRMPKSALRKRHFSRSSR